MTFHQSSRQEIMLLCLQQACMTKLHSHGNAHRHALVYTDSSSTLAVCCNTAGVFILSGTCTQSRGLLLERKNVSNMSTRLLSFWRLNNGSFPRGRRRTKRRYEKYVECDSTFIITHSGYYLSITFCCQFLDILIIATNSLSRS